MGNREKLRELLLEVFLLDDSEFRFSLTRTDIDTWDSLGNVSLGVAVEEAFGYHLTPEEVIGLTGFADLISTLESHGIPFGPEA